MFEHQIGEVEVLQSLQSRHNECQFVEINDEIPKLLQRFLEQGIVCSGRILQLGNSAEEIAEAGNREKCV